MRVTFLGGGSLLLAALRRLRDKAGTLVVLSSVAAERPRAANAVYGAAKAGLDALAQGLSDSLAGSGVRVLVVRPGFVRTRMTEGLKPAPFATTPEAVADATVTALTGSRAHHLGSQGLTLRVRGASPPAPSDLPQAAAVRRNTLLVDVAIALALTIIALIVLPGLAIVAIVAADVLVVCAATLRSARCAGCRGRGADPAAPAAAAAAQPAQAPSFGPPMTGGRGEGAAEGLTRRSVLRGAAVAGAAALVEPAAAVGRVGASGAGRPRICVQPLGRGAGRPVASPGRSAPRGSFSLIGVEWSEPASARIELRARSARGRLEPVGRRFRPRS